MTSWLSDIKFSFVPSGKKEQKIKSGIFKGLRMELDLSCQTQLYLGLYEREVYKWVKKLSPGINTAIDVGAGDGIYTLYFLEKTSAKKVFAFEPLERRRAQTIINLDLNGLTHVPRLELSSKYVCSREGENECILDSLLTSIFVPCLIKIDVDGDEVNILKGASKLLALPQIYWIVETHSKQLEEECIKIFERAGFRTKIIPNAWWRTFIPDLRPSPQNRWLIAIKKAR